MKKDISDVVVIAFRVLASLPLIFRSQQLQISNH